MFRRLAPLAATFLMLTGCPTEYSELSCPDQTMYRDADQDGWGDAAVDRSACLGLSEEEILLLVTLDGDCDDTNPERFPGNPEVCDGLDNDCDELVDDLDDSLGADQGAVYYQDADGDGAGDLAAQQRFCVAPQGWVSEGSDCDDTAATVHPGADEYCNEVDDDCNGVVDDDPVDPSSWYPDLDGDGYGDADMVEPIVSCSAPGEHWVDNAEDCNDASALHHPGADESDCTDPEDYNCDGSVGYADADEDGWAACEDCDDSAPAINPLGTEVCDGQDNDCDGTVDESDAVDALTWYADADGDGYGDASSTTPACEQPSGYCEDDTDCDDMDASVYPGATTWYLDHDSDGYGDPVVTNDDCAMPSGYVADSTDCDDRDASVSPAGTEVCDGEDNDCDGAVDEDDASDALTWYADADSDGFGDASTTDTACDAPSGYVADATDCDDTDASVSPGATESCTEVDDDCDGLVDDDDPDVTGTTTWYIDGDGDGFGSSMYTVDACEVPSGYVSDDTDCDDVDDDTYPGADEYCDEIDNDCDGEVDEDDAVDGDTWYADTDGDGYGDPNSTTTACTEPTGYVDNDEDCDDTDATVSPEGTEDPGTTADDDCDGYTWDGWLVVTSDATGADEIWAISDDGSHYVQLTDSLSSSVRMTSAVSWDGASIAFTKGSTIYVMDSDGDNMTTVGSSGLGYSSWISWMADSERLLHVGTGTCTEPIMELDVNTGSKSTFYDVSNILQRPEANPVDEDLILVSNYSCGSGTQTVYLYDAGSASRTAITSYAQWWEYAWSVDGASIAYVTASSSYQDLVIDDLSSSTVLYSASGSDMVRRPAWGNDDAYIYLEESTSDDLLRIDASTGTATSLGVTDLAGYYRLSWGRLGDIDRDGDGLGNAIDPYPDTP